jgi:periplasmic protein TonB
MPHPDILDDRDELRKPFMASLMLHGGVVVLLVAGKFIPGRTTQNWGDPDARGSSVAVRAVSSVPMAARSGAVNPVANDTESQVPKAPPVPKPVKKAKEPEPEAIPIKGRAEPKKLSKVTSDPEKFRPYTDPKPNQVYSTTGGATVSPMIGAPGSGTAGIGNGSVLGDRFGAYTALLTQRISQNWKTQDIDPRIRTAPAAIVNFTILRNGTIKDIAVKTSSGNAAIDRSAIRALYDVGKFEPLPAGWEHDDVVIEFWFELKR